MVVVKHVVASNSLNVRFFLLHVSCKKAWFSRPFLCFLAFFKRKGKKGFDRGGGR